MSDVIAGRIDLLDPLARGASGALWRAVDLRFEAICAAKVMRQRDGADVLRFVREQSVGAHGPRALGAHPHLLPPYTWVAEDDAVVLAMPLIRGGTLGQSLADHGALHPLLVAEVTRQLLDALAAMHEKRWLHRDVKPANLLLQVTGTEPPHLRLADFGIALHEDDARLTETGFVHGTPGFMSPERLRGEGASAAQDVWAAGAVALRSLGVRADLEAGEDPQALLAGALDGTHPRLQETLHAMLEDDPSRRPTASAARDALPAAPHTPSAWVLTADGDPFEVFDLLDPLPQGSPARDLPEIPADGPSVLSPRSTSLHERISERAQRGTPSTDRVERTDHDETHRRDETRGRDHRDDSPGPDGGDGQDAGQLDGRPTRAAPPESSGEPTHSPGTPSRTGLRPVILLAALAALALVVAVVLGVLAIRDGSDSSGRQGETGGRSASPLASATDPPTASDDATDSTDGSPSADSSAPSAPEPSTAPVAGRACAWNLEGEEATTPDGTAVSCRRSGDDTFTWEER